MSITGTIMARRKRPALLRAKGRPMVRDAARRAAPHHEAEKAPRKKRALILRSPAKPGVSKDEGPQAFALYRLMAWLSPAFPVGAFSYSSGIEWAVEAGDIKDAETLKAWLGVMLAEGGGFCDAVFFVHAHRAAAADDDQTLRVVTELAAAFAPSKERHLEITAQGNAFVEATRAAWPCAALDRLKVIWDGPVAYPVAVAVAAAGHAIALEPALAAFLQAVAANWVSAGVRLIPLGQTDGQRVLASLEPIVAATAQRPLATSLDDLGSSAFRADLASARHETQYTRLFRS
jgi:urease accessory protein